MVRSSKQESNFAKSKRLNSVNELIKVIATHGRKFFRHKENIAYMEIDSNGRIWFIDDYKGARIYTHYRREWREFSHGGTLKSLVEAFRDYIQTGYFNFLQLGPWPDWVCNSDLWGYEQDMSIVRKKAKELLKANG